MRNLWRFLVASGALLFLGVNVGVAFAFNGPPPGSPPTGDGSIVTDASNRVGLGTAAPDQLLTVKGGMVHVANGAVLTTTPGSAAGYGLFIGTDNTTGESRIQTYWDAGTAFLTFHTNSGGLASVERARIDAGGLTTTGFKLTTGPVSGYVLTSNAQGVGTWAASAGDITGVTAGTGLFGGGTSGAVTVSLAAPVAATNGGTAQTTYATGDLLYASGLNTLAKRAIGSAGQVLTVSGGAPAWATPLAGTVTSVSGSGGVTGLTLTGGPITTSGTLTIGGTLAVANGGTGAATAATARTNLGAAASGANSDIASLSGLTTALSATQGGTAQTTYIAGDMLYSSGLNTLAKRAIGAAGQVLTVSGGVPVWATPLAGTVTSVSGSGGTTGLTLSGGPITTSGTLTIGGTLAVASGGTGASTASGARTNLGAAASGANSDITSISGLTTPLSATQGGTAQTTYTTGDILYSSAANTLTKRTIGTAGQVLTVSGGVPVWAPPPTSITSLNAQTGAAQTFANDTNVTIASSLNTHTLGWSGTLAVGRGGTGAATLPANNVLLGNDTAAVQSVAPGTSGNVLTSDGTTWVSQAPSGTPSSYTVVRFITSGSTGVVTVSCPAGKKVLGGGCYGYYGSCRLRDSFPQSVILGDVTEGWYCRFMQYNSTGNCGGPNQAAYVACM